MRSAPLDLMQAGLRFPFCFDLEQLRGDLAEVQPHEWAPHYNDSDYGGIWRGVALRSASGTGADLQAVAPGGFSDTDLLERCPYFRRVLSVFECPLKSVRLLSLAPQSFIREHSDRALGYEDGEIRIHIPIQTNANVEFYVAGERLLLEEGGSYYVNVNLPHRVNNRGSADRIHLVIDAEVNEWVRDLFQRGESEGWHIPRCPLPPGSLDDFRRYVLADEGLQNRLKAIEDRAVFVAAVLRMGEESGFTFHEGDVRAGFRTPVDETDALPIKGWTPTRVTLESGQPVAEWLWTGGRRFTAPFFADAVQECARLPFSALFRRSASLELAQETDALVPSGFVFHMSRCGSTLVSRMLAALPQVSMISEPAPLDEVLRTERVEWLRWMVAALGQRRSAEQSRYFLKMDAWHIHQLPLIRQAFPDTPWVFLYRDPVEVVVSQLRSPGLLGAPGAMDPAVLRMKPEDFGLERQEWCVRVLAAIMRSACQFAGDPNGRFINYRQLPRAVFETIGPHVNFDFTPTEQDRMLAATEFDAKRPGFPFQSDSAAKQLEVSPRLRELSGEWLDPLYLRMEQFHS